VNTALNASPVLPLDLDHILRRIGEFPVIGIAHLGTAEMQTRWARDDLKSRSILLRGHRSAIDALVTYEVEHKSSQLQAFDEYVDELLNCRTDGRPNKHSALRDLLIFAQQFLLQSLGKLEAREARKRTAQIFSLTCDTRFARTRRPSIDQVKWAEDRTIHRFALLQQRWRGDQLLSLTWLKAVHVLGFYIAEMNGAPLDPETYFSDVTCLVSICRTVDAVERLNRIEKSAAARTAKRLTRPPGPTRPLVRPRAN
jgi:hypothetical protein